MKRLSSVELGLSFSRAWRPAGWIAAAIAAALIGTPSTALAQVPRLRESPRQSASQVIPVQATQNSGQSQNSAANQGGHHHGHHHGHQHGHHQGHQHGHHHGNFNRGWGGWGGSSFGGTNFTVVGPGYYSSFAVGSYSPGFFPGYYPGNFPGYWSPGWYGPPYGYGYGYPYAWYPPPLVVPAEVMYGPRPIWNMLGIGFDGLGAAGGVAPGIAQAAVAPGNAQAALNVPANPAVGGVRPNAPLQPIKLRKSSDAARGRALQMLAVADGDFRAQKYVEAASRYRRATQSAPDLAEAYFRQGQAEIALSRYESAAKSHKRAVEVDAGWPKSNLRLAQLYGGNNAAKTAHVEKLAQEAAANPNDTDLRYLIGVELFFDGQLDRAKTFFAQAAALNPGDDAHLLAFLQEIDRRAPPKVEAGAVDL